MIKIVVATNNHSKYLSIKNLISRTSFCDRINIVHLPSNIKSPNESEKTSLKNALIKANYFDKLLKTPFIVIDDSITLSPKIGLNYGYKFHRLGKDSNISNKKIFVYLQNELQNKHPIKLKRIRNIIFVFNGKYQKAQNSFRCILEPLEKSTFNRLKNMKLSDNPLNYFSVVPHSTHVRLWELTSEKRNKLIYTTVCVNKINSIIKKYLNT